MMIENHNQTLDTTNNFLFRNNLIIAERIRKLQEQIDRASVEVHRLWVKAYQVRGDIMKYRRTMDTIDVFLKSIANKGNAFNLM
jgi:hypothetical protein